MTVEPLVATTWRCVRTKGHAAPPIASALERGTIAVANAGVPRHVSGICINGTGKARLTRSLHISQVVVDTRGVDATNPPRVRTGFAGPTGVRASKLEENATPTYAEAAVQGRRWNRVSPFCYCDQTLISH